MRTFKMTLFAVLLSALAVLSVAGLGMSDESQPAPGTFVPAPMENHSVAPAPMEGHSLAPAGY